MSEHETIHESQPPVMGVESALVKNRRWLIPTIITSLVILSLIVGGIVWYSIRVQRQVETAKTVCETGLKTARAAVDDWEKFTHSDQVKNASTISDKQVADSKTVDTLQDLITTTVKTPTACTGSTVTDYKQITRLNASVQKQAEDSKTVLVKAVQTVTASRDKKTLLDAQNKLKSMVASAKQTYTDSQGNVSDDTVRTDLQSLINQAEKMPSDVKTVIELTDKLVTAVTKVLNAVKAKQEADAQIEAEAAAQAEAESQNTSSNTWNNQSYTQPVTPQETIPVTPTPSTPITPNQTPSQSQDNTKDEWSDLTFNPATQQGQTWVPIG